MALNDERLFRLTVHKAGGAPYGAIVNELELRILNKDRVPMGQLEQGTCKTGTRLYPQSLLGRQVALDGAGRVRSGRAGSD